MSIKKPQGVHVLSEKEFNHIKILNLALHYNVLKDLAISSFLYYVCTTRFGYEEGQNLVFEIDLDKDSRELTVKVVPNDELKKAMK